MHYHTFHKIFIPKQMICLFYISLLNLFPNIGTTDISSIFLHLIYHNDLIAIHSCIRLQQFIITGSIMSKTKIRTNHDTFYGK